MDRLFEDLALKIEGEVKSYVTKRRFNKMLDELREDNVSDKTLKEALSFDISKKSTEEQEINKILIGFMVDNFVKENGQEALNELIDELVEKQKQSEGVMIKPEVVVASEPQQPEAVEEKVIAPEQPEEIEEVPEQEIVEEVTEEVPEQEIVEEVEPTNDNDTVEPVVEPTPEPIEEVIEPVVEEEVVADEVEEEEYLQPTPQPELEPQRPEPEVQPEVVQPQPEMIRPTSVSSKDDSISSVEDEPELEDEDLDYEEEYDEVENDKKGGVLKYLAVGIPTLLLVGGLVFWQMNNQKQINTKAEAQATEILKGMPKEAKKGKELSNSEYEDNIDALTKGIDTIKQDDNTGLSGYLVYDDKKYIIKKYEQESGSLIVFNEEGKEIKFDNEWVEKLVKKAKTNKKTEASAVEKKTDGNPTTEQQEKKQEENSERKPDGNSNEQQEGGSV